MLFEDVIMPFIVCFMIDTCQEFKNKCALFTLQAFINIFGDKNRFSRRELIIDLMLCIRKDLSKPEGPVLKTAMDELEKGVDLVRTLRQSFKM